MSKEKPKFVVGDEPSQDEAMFPLVAYVEPKSKPHTMRVYQNTPVTMTYQNFGSTWLCILRGKATDIDDVFNGLFNYRGTNGEYQFFDHAQTVALFWSDRKAMRRFFFNQYFFPKSDGNYGLSKRQLVKSALRYAYKKLDELAKHCHESFMDFTSQYEPTVHGIGRISDARPDNDFKDAVLSHAFANKNS